MYSEAHGVELGFYNSCSQMWVAYVPHPKLRETRVDILCWQPLNVPLAPGNKA
jgi:hypothetical protein